MNYKQLNIKRRYISYGEDNMADAFLVPALKCTKYYKRSVGYFSSGVLESIIDGIVAMARNNGKIQLIASPQLSENDVDAITLGYAKREQIIKEVFDRDFTEQMESIDDDILQLLVDLIAKGILDIKIAVTDNIGIYHDKLGVMEDFDGNSIVFYGSSNSSISGYRYNYEKIRLSRSWMQGEDEVVDDEREEFESLWNGTNPFVTVYEYKESAKKNILKIIEYHKNKDNTAKQKPIELYDYQKEAIEAWEANDYHGFYVMATGTGKTWTAIYSAKELISKHPAMIVICAPYKHLIKQWEEDVKKVFPNANTILVSSENSGWDAKITNAILCGKYQKEHQIIIISTIASFKKNKFMDVINKSNDDKLLIVDEAHRFTDRPEELKDSFQYRLGLSATPYNGTSSQRGKELMQYFGGQVFNLPIEEALKRGCLVPYNYYPIYVEATPEEEEKFNKYTRKILSCFKNNKCIDSDTLIKNLRNRIRVIAMAEEKQSRIDDILKEVKEKDHFIVYCGDGHVFDSASGEEIRHIQSVKKVLTNHEYKASQFTARENMKDRMELVDMFNKGEISALAAIRCLDEGINIPSIKSALILASNDDYREFVQRRGRILRKYKDKDYANIYDVIVLPSNNMQSWAKIEFRRFLEYAKLALNWNELEGELESYLSQYGLDIDDINIYDYDDIDDMEEELDE